MTNGGDRAIICCQLYPGRYAPIFFYKFPVLSLREIDTTPFDEKYKDLTWEERRKINALQLSIKVLYNDNDEENTQVHLVTITKGYS